MLKILKVTNLIPVRIDYVLDGKEKFAYAYIDYETQTVIGVDEVPKEILSDFEQSVSLFISQPVIEFDVPQTYPQNSLNINDYIPEDLNVQLKGR